jgi:hypothetical protein
MMVTIPLVVYGVSVMHNSSMKRQKGASGKDNYTRWTIDCNDWAMDFNCGIIIYIL